ncbi:MAG: HAMP domain-containing histidine kinase [Rhodospirillales bacterium]|nr:HAMP domain-containing histidine kinase [Rhodospirillales bacterium]
MENDHEPAPVPFRLWRALLAEAGPAWLADLDGRVLFRTRAFTTIFGNGAELPPRLLAALRQIRDLGHAVQAPLETDRKRWQAVYFPIFDAEGTTVAVGGILRPAGSPHASDEMRQAAAEARLLELEEQIAEAERRKAALLQTMSHELLTPLNAVVGFSEAALQEVRGPLPAAYREYLEHIRNAGRHAGDIVQTLLDAARLDETQVATARRPISARRLVAEARAMVALRAVEEGVDVSRVTLERDDLVETDPLRARQILVNLLVNAIKFTPRGGAVGIDAQRSEPDCLDLVVWDTGIGISLAEQERIFEPFYQAGGALRAGSGGAGLGLAISRQLARLLGGDIFLSSEPGKGSRFTVRLPRLTSPA